MFILVLYHLNSHENNTFQNDPARKKATTSAIKTKLLKSASGGIYFTLLASWTKKIR